MIQAFYPSNPNRGYVRRAMTALAAGIVTAIFATSPVFAQTPDQSAEDHSTHNHSSHKTDATIPPLLAAPAPEGTFSPLPTDHIMGQADAPTTIIIYASLTCPHCGDWFTNTWPDLKKNYVKTGKTRIVFREFITPPAQLAVAGFQIANCAPHTKFFSLIEHQMQNQKTIYQAVQMGKGEETYLTIANKAGIKTVEAMQTCFNNESGQERLQLAYELASAAEVSSVPAFLINGSLYEGKSEYEPLTKEIDRLIQDGK